MAKSVRLKDGSYIDSSGIYDVTNSKTLEQALEILLADGAGAHNSHYRGKYLGTSVTSEQWAAIKAGTFRDLYIGDYWTINSVNWRIAHFDYYFNISNVTTHHAVIVPDTVLYTAKMNDSHTTTGAYVGSKMYTTNLTTAKTTINNAFGSAHILNHKVMLANAISGNAESSATWYVSTVELMNERMVYGADVYHTQNVDYQHTVDKEQLALFGYDAQRLNLGTAWYLRDVAGSQFFCCVYASGTAAKDGAAGNYGVRPYFCIYSA